MPTVYSNQFAASTARAFSAGAEAAAVTYAGKGGKAEVSGSLTTVVAEYNLANGALNATNTPLVLASLPPSCRLREIVISSGDDDVDSDNNFTFDLGWSGSLDAILNDSTALQAGAETTLGWEELEEIVTPSSGWWDLILTRVAGDLNSSGTIRFVITYVIP